MGSAPCVCEPAAPGRRLGLPVRGETAPSPSRGGDSARLRHALVGWPVPTELSDAPSAPRRGHRVPAPARDPPARRARAHGLRGPGREKLGPYVSVDSLASPPRASAARGAVPRCPPRPRDRGAARRPGRRAGAPRVQGQAPPARRLEQSPARARVRARAGLEKTLSRMVPTPTFTLLAWRRGASLPA